MSSELSNTKSKSEDHRSKEEKLESLVEKDVHPRVTTLAKRALERRRQEDSS